MKYKEIQGNKGVGVVTELSTQSLNVYVLYVSRSIARFCSSVKLPFVSFIASVYHVVLFCPLPFPLVVVVVFMSPSSSLPALPLIIYPINIHFLCSSERVGTGFSNFIPLRTSSLVMWSVHGILGIPL